MRTLITAAVAFLFSVTLGAQEYVAVHSGITHTNSTHFSSKRTSKTTVSSLTLEIFQATDFKYRRFLKDAASTSACYVIGSKSYTKKELTKLFRKGARRSENIIEFEQFLTNTNPQFSTDVSEREMTAIYTKLREGTLHAYLDTLPSALL